MVIILSRALVLFAQNTDAPAGFDGQTNGMVDQATHAADQDKFEEVEGIKDGLGPLYNAQSCRECHQSLATGGNSQISEFGVGHRGANGQLENPRIPINDGQAVITGRT